MTPHQVFLDAAELIALALLSATFLLTVYRVVRGPTLPDRILGLDMLVVSAIGFIAVIGIRTGYTLYVDIAIALGLVGFLGPVVRVAYPDGENVASGYEAASTVAINLWLVPCVAATWAAIVARRRTLAAMRGARLAIPLLALLAAGSLGFTFWKMSAGAAQIVRAYGRDVLIEPRWGFWLMAVGVVLAFGGGLRLGAAKERKPRYRVD